jgi:trehalose 6-phosphate phosphatase
VDALDRLAAEPALAALLLDVDGTLAPIVAEPEDARVPDGTRSELTRLAGSYGLVACVTGRPAEVARAIVGLPELTYVGEHGLELDPEAEKWAEPIHGFAIEVPWVDVEVKPLSVAFHYRTAPDHERAREALEEVAAGALDLGFRPRGGRMVLEVLPPVDASKGTAVRHLVKTTGLRRALYAGDDTTDVDAFRAVHELEVGVAVAVRSAELPGAVEANADVLVDGTAGMLDLLSSL